MKLHVLTLSDTGSILTGAGGRLAAFDLEAEATHAARQAATGFDCREIAIRTVDECSSDAAERRCYRAILSYNMPAAVKVAQDSAATSLRATSPWVTYLG